MSDQVKTPNFFVGVGASAGGLEALDMFFTEMPVDSGLGFIVIQHLSPDYKSLMVELLSKRTEMTVKRAEEGMLVEANCVYLIPPRKQLTIFHGKLILHDQDHSRGLNLPIDVFFRSLAEDQGEKAIGIILSGTGSDGVRGIRAIKEAGGMVMVQSEDSSKFDGMPRAAMATGLVDIVQSPDAMPGKLLSFIKHPFSASKGPTQELLSDEDGVTRIFALLREQTKVDFTYYKPSTVFRRIERRINVSQCENLREYVRLLESNPSEVSVLYSELLIGVTSFFRDREIFRELQANYLKELFSRNDQKEIRFWVPGCSTGEEAYTLAILAAEYIAENKGSRNVKIFATDIDRNAIISAGNGMYAESIAADLPQGVLSKYFLHVGEHYQVSRQLREMVVFAQHNVVKDPPFTNISLLSCRNLLIYLQPVLQQKVFEYFNFSLHAQGLLLLGTSESPGEMAPFFEPVHNRFKIFRAKGIRGPSTEKPLFQGMGDRASSQTVPTFLRNELAVSYKEEGRIQDRLLQALSGDYFPLVAVINERMELQHVVGNPQGLLKVPTGKHSNDIIRMVIREISIPLATGLQKIIHGKQDITYTNIRIKNDESSRSVKMHIKYLPEKKNQESLIAIIITDAHEKTKTVSTDENDELDITKESEQRIVDLEQELQFTKENLQATIEELETSNEELQATNEELLASNEELQSTNEELQSVNEELHTVNAEYQKKIMELTEITNDLENLMSATQIATIFLDENHDIRKFTPELTNIFRILPSDVGRLISHLTHRLLNIDILELLKDVERTGKSIEVEGITDEEKSYYLRIIPYSISKSDHSGLLITFTEISSYKRNKRALEVSNEILLKTQEMASVGSWKHNISSGDIEWSEEVFHICGIEPFSCTPSHELFMRIVHPDDRAYVTDVYSRTVETGTAYDASFRLLMENGDVKFVRAKSFELTVSDGMVTFVIGMIQDQTEIISSKELLQIFGDYLKEIIDAMPSQVAILHEDGEIEYVNKAWRQFWEKRDGEVSICNVGKNYLQECLKIGDEFLQEKVAIEKVLSEEIDKEDLPYTINYSVEIDNEPQQYTVAIMPFKVADGKRIKIRRENIKN